MAVLRWGIIGPGRISTRIVRALASSSRGTLAAVASRDPDRAAAYASRHGVGRSFGSYDELLASSEIDVVYIALPNHLHAQWTIRALEAGKHVLCEKPLALTVGDVDAIQAAARMTGRIAVEAFMYLHHPQILRALEVAGDGLLGPLELILGTFSFLLSTRNGPGSIRRLGELGSLWDVGCYPVNFARRLAGRNDRSSPPLPGSTKHGVDRSRPAPASRNGLLASSNGRHPGQ